MRVSESIKKSSHTNEEGKDLSLISESISKLNMRKSIPDAEEGVWSLHRDYLETLRHMGYDKIFKDRSHIAIQHIPNNLRLHYPKSRMKDIILWHMKKQFDRKDLNTFMQTKAKQTKQLRREKGLPSTEHECGILPEDEIRHTVAGRTKSRFKIFKIDVRVKMSFYSNVLTNTQRRQRSRKYQWHLV